MNRNLASTLTLTTTAAAALVLAALASGNAYADDITIDTTPFVSSKSRAEVRAELMAMPAESRRISEEWGPANFNQASQAGSTLTRAQVKAEYLAHRSEVNAFNAEDSGSSYSASVPRRVNGGGVIMAGD